MDAGEPVCATGANLQAMAGPQLEQGPVVETPRSGTPRNDRARGRAWGTGETLPDPVGL